MLEEELDRKIEELVEAVLVIGAMRGSMEDLQRDEALQLTKQHVKSLSIRFKNLLT